MFYCLLQSLQSCEIRLSSSISRILSSAFYLLSLSCPSPVFAHLFRISSCLSSLHHFSHPNTCISMHAPVFEPGRDFAALSRFLFECRTKINHPRHHVATKKYEMLHVFITRYATTMCHQQHNGMSLLVYQYWMNWC